MAFGGNENDVIALPHELRGYERIALVEPYRDKSAPSYFLEFVGGGLFHRSAFCRHEESQPFRRFDGFWHRENRGDLFILLERDEIHDGFPLRRALPFRKFVHFQLIHFAAVGEKEEVRVRACRQKLRDEVFFFRIEVDDADAASLLSPVFRRVRPLDVASRGQDQDRIFVRNEVFRRKQLHFAFDYLRPARVAVFLHHVVDLFLDKRHQFLLALQKRGQFLDERLHFLQFIFYLLAFESGEFLEPHLEYCVRLLLRELEFLHQGYARVINGLRFLDERDYLVDVIERLLQPKKDVFALLRFRKIEFRPKGNNLFSVCNKILQERLERKCLRHAVDERDDIVMERFFKLGMFVEVIEDRLRVRRILQFNDDANVFGGFVADIAYAFELFLVHEIGNLGKKVRLVHSERDGRDDYLVVSLFPFNYFRVSTDDDRAAPRRVCVRDIFLIERNAACRKIGTLDELEEVIRCCIGSVDEMDCRFAHFPQIVRRDVRGHADRDTQSAV